MAFVELKETKQAAKVNGLKAYGDVFEGYVKALASPKYANKTRVKAFEMDISKHNIKPIKSASGANFYIAEIPTLYKDGSKGTKQVVLRAFNPATKTLAYMKSYYDNASQ